MPLWILLAPLHMSNDSFVDGEPANVSSTVFLLWKRCIVCWCLGEWSVSQLAVRGMTWKIGVFVFLVAMMWAIYCQTNFSISYVCFHNWSAYNRIELAIIMVNEMCWCSVLLRFRDVFLTCSPDNTSLASCYQQSIYGSSNSWIFVRKKSTIVEFKIERWVSCQVPARLLY